MAKYLSSLALSISLSLGAGAVKADDLLDVYNIALAKDPQILKAAADAQAQKEGIDIALSSLYPQLNFSTSVSKNFSDREFNVANDETEEPIFVKGNIKTITNSYEFSLTQEVFNLATWDNLDRAKKVALQANSNYQLIKQQLINRVSEAYFDVLKAQDDLEFVRSEKRAFERQLEQTKQRFEVGLTAITDVHEAQAEYDNSVATEIRSDNDVEINKEVLREITGKYHRILSLLNTERFAASTLGHNAEYWVTAAENSNLELKTQQLTVDIARTDIELAFDDHLPSLSFSADKGQNNTNRQIVELPDRPDIRSNASSSKSHSFGLNLTVPIFSGGRTNASVKQAQANFISASEDLELTYRRVMRQVRSSYADVVSLVSSIKALEQAVISAESALSATEAGFEVGTRTIVDVLQSTKNLYDAKRNLSRARYDYIIAMLSLKQAAGSLNSSDVEGVNHGLMLPKST